MTAIASDFLTLADQLALSPQPAARSTETGLVVVLDGVEERNVLASLPRGSALVGLGTEDAPGSLETLRDAVARAGDVLFVSDPSRLDEATLDRLRATMAVDSSCASVSVGPDPQVQIEGLPSPPVERPIRGVVLASRDHLLLALDEASILGAESVGLEDGFPTNDLVDDVLRCIVRPGFVHRVAGRDAVVGILERPSRQRTRRRLFPILVDGRCLSSSPSGTQVQVINLIGGLARAGAELSVLAPRELHPAAERAFVDVAAGVRLVQRDQVGKPAVFHRPFQIGSLAGLRDCLGIGDRLVLTHQDMISARTVAYAPSRRAWELYRAATTAALTSADEVVFFSRHAAIDAASECELDPSRASVVELGVDHLTADTETAEVRPLGGRPFLFVLGNAYWHKNRVFAIRLVQWLVETRGWDGGLVLAGAHPGHGSSVRAEQVLVGRTPSLAGRVADLGVVTSAEQASLYRSAGAVLFPSVHEGFGFIPFEAAVFDRACVYSHRSSMRELLPATGALPSFDVEEAGQLVARLLAHAEERVSIVADIRRTAAKLTWDRTAAGYLEIYRRAVECEPVGVSRSILEAPHERQRLSEMELLVLDVYRRRRAFRVAVDSAVRVGGLVLRGARRTHGRGRR